MQTLTNAESKLVDEYFVRNNFVHFDEAHFISALGTIVPTWRLEELVGQEKVYKEITTQVYKYYINNLVKETNENS